MLPGKRSEELVCQKCDASLHRCGNSTQYGVCNVAVASAEPLCHYCTLSTVIPNLDDPHTLAQWGRLEAAKRRVLFIVESLGFAVDPNADQFGPGLSFEFKADGEEPVSTGHADGVITINILEADTVEREKARVEFGEPTRTLVGHFRHELGHYYWQRRVQGQVEQEFRAIYGDERSPSYQEALELYYENGGVQDWNQQYVSRYASMHPWEDFAETFSAYLDMAAILDTARHFQLTEYDANRFDSMLGSYQKLGIAANEFNRDMGLFDLVPEVFVPPVAEKLRFVHQLREAV